MPARKKREKREPKSVDAACDALYRAAGDYIEALGGSAVMAIGTQLMTWPGDRPQAYSLVVKLYGRKPEIAARRVSRPRGAGKRRKKLRTKAFEKRAAKAHAELAPTVQKHIDALERSQRLTADDFNLRVNV